MIQSPSLFQRWRGLWPGQMHRIGPRLAAWVDLLVVDLGLLRLPVNHPVEVVPGIWRSNQPTPWRLKRLAGCGFKSVLNLRGEGNSGAFHLEQYGCQQSGLQLYSIKISSRRAPERKQIEEIIELLHNAPKPLLLHCKSGADRAGLVSALAVIEFRDQPEAALGQLSLRFLHIKHASTGMMDHFIATYLKAYRADGTSLTNWLKERYDRKRMQQSFKVARWRGWLVDSLLRRE